MDSCKQVIHRENDNAQNYPVMLDLLRQCAHSASGTILVENPGDITKHAIGLLNELNYIWTYGGQEEDYKEGYMEIRWQGYEFLNRLDRYTAAMNDPSQKHKIGRFDHKALGPWYDAQMGLNRTV